LGCAIGLGHSEEKVSQFRSQVAGHMLRPPSPVMLSYSPPRRILVASVLWRFRQPKPPHWRSIPVNEVGKRGSSVLVPVFANEGKFEVILRDRCRRLQDPCYRARGGLKLVSAKGSGALRFSLQGVRGCAEEGRNVAGSLVGARGDCRLIVSESGYFFDRSDLLTG
jgi:hypothetical protein